MKERTEVAAALAVWREGLVNLSGVNRLIKFKASKSGTVAINRPDPQEIFSGLSAGTEWKFQGAPDRRVQDGDDPPEEDDESTIDPVVDVDIKGAVLHSPGAMFEWGSQRLEVSHVHKVECVIPWLNDALVYFTVSLQLCQQLKDKIAVFSSYWSSRPF